VYAKELVKPKKEGSKQNKIKAKRCKLYIMTSDVTHDKIVNFFEENSNFGV
jgi:UDP-N-acetylglucosamine/UDP-N-acetylgalactosamine diphosphorylase